MPRWAALPTIATEVFELLEKEAAPYLAGFVVLSVLFLFSFFFLPFLLVGFSWYASSVGLTSLFEFVVDLAKPDPLDF